MDSITIFLAGDVMLGRGIDQILLHPSDPQLFEPYVNDARIYVELAENLNGDIPRTVSKDYIWGDALEAWRHFKPDVKIINLETAICQSDDYCRQKSIHYRMHPQNISVLQYPGIDICTLANNHVLDWGTKGLEETLNALQKASVGYAGAGKNDQEAMAPAIFELSEDARILVLAAGTESSGIPASWPATKHKSGVYRLPDLGKTTLDEIATGLKILKKPNDLVIFSIHWGSNWGYEVPNAHREFAHGLIDLGVDVVFGHSSHHPRPIEIYHNKPILYGCGDFINDYEGIENYSQFRGDLSLMYFLEFDRQNLQFKQMQLVPTQIKNFRLHFANETDSQWISQILASRSWSTHLNLSKFNEKFVITLNQR